MSDQRERWTGWLALSTAVMAVFAALTTLYVGKYSSRAVMMQGQESNQWAHYQAKSIKQHTYEIQKERMELEVAAQEGRLAPKAGERYAKTIALYGDEVKRYEAEKKDIRAKAEDLATKKEAAQHMAGSFGYSLIFLQIAIMLSSIASLTKKPSLWYFGMANVSGWILFFADAFLRVL